MFEFEEETIDQIARLYDRHDRRTTRVQRLANRVTVTLEHDTIVQFQRLMGTT